MLKIANLILIVTVLCTKHNNDYIILNQLEMRTDTSLQKTKFINNMAEYSQLHPPTHTVQPINLV
jgi:hypothetical protein